MSSEMELVVDAGGMFDVCMAKSWTCGRSGSCRSLGRATSSQMPRATGGLIWGRQAGRC